jgi:hypothetical protein
MVPCKLTTRMSRLRCVGYPHLRQPPCWIEYNAIRWDLVGSGRSHRCSAFYPVETQVRTPAFLLEVITKIVVDTVLILSAAYVLGVYGKYQCNRVAKIRAALAVVRRGFMAESNHQARSDKGAFVTVFAELQRNACAPSLASTYSNLQLWARARL